MSSSEKFRAERRVGIGSGFGHVVDEVGGDGYLSACIAELGESGVEEAILFVERFNIGVGMRFFGLEGHIRVCDLGDWRAVILLVDRRSYGEAGNLQVEDHSECENKTGNC